MLRKIIRKVQQIDDILEHLVFDSRPARRVAAAVLLLAVALTMGSGSPPRETMRPQDATLLMHRPWLDRLPENWDSKFRVYYFGDYPLEGGDLLFAHQCGTPAHHLTRFGGLNPKTPKLGMRWLGKGGAGETKFRITRGQFGPFDLKLELGSDPAHGGRRAVYFSRADCHFESVPADILKVLQTQVRR